MHLKIDANVHRGFVTKLYLEIMKKLVVVCYFILATTTILDV